MERKYDNYSGSRLGGVCWSFIGYLSFGLLGILLGAALVYGLFTFYLVPAIDDPVIEEAANGLQEEVQPVPSPGFDSNLADIIGEIMPAVVGVNKHIFITRFGEPSLEQVESGSGVIIASDGYIVTNHHVVEGAESITVIIPDRGRYEAELIGFDVLTDLALLRVDESGLTEMALGDSDLIRVGETVMAIGNPLGFFQQSVTAGIISAVGRQVRFPGSEYAHTFVQTDALVNPGNSGGPLVNTDGEIVGINTAKISLLGVEGIGLSIPSNTVSRVMADLVEHGRVIRPHLGVIIDDWVDYSDAEPEKGVLIIEIAPDSAADEAGLLAGDIIVSMGGQDIEYMAQLFDRLLHFYPGDTMTIIYFRDEQQEEVTVTLGERPENFGFEMEPELEDPTEPEVEEPESEEE